VFIALVGTLHLYTDTDDQKFLREAMNILDHAGYSVAMYNVHGATVYDERMKTWNSYVMFNTLTGYAVVIFCSIKIRKFIQSAAMSSKTKRLNADMDKVLFSLVSFEFAKF
jgi:Ca2+/Na+ antiporter